MDNATAPKAGTMILCGALQPGVRTNPCRCTREPNHPGDHIAGVGPYVPGEMILAQWSRAPVLGHDADDMAVDGQGNPLAYTPAEVRSILNEMLDTGEVIAVILRDRDGALGVQVFGPPSRELLDVLQTATQAYRRTLRGH
jgi:hypothetical protein